MTSTPPPTPRVSPLDAIGEAIDRTRSRLFPFRFERWLALGFVAFLDQCGRSGGHSFNVPSGNPGGGAGHGSAPDLNRVGAWLGSHVGLVVVVAAAVMAAVILLTALVLWLNSRGIFMYLDDVATGRADVARPWREHAERAQSLFAWRFVIGIATLLAVGLIVGLSGALVLACIKGRLAVPVAVALGLLLLLPAFAVVVVVGGLVSLGLRDFVAPLQWRLGLPCGEAARVAWGLARSNRGAFAVYVLLKIAFAVAAAVILLVAGCVTCCCGFLPVVSQTLLQPLFYFERTWSLVFLRQLGHDVFAQPEPQPEPLTFAPEAG